MPRRVLTRIVPIVSGYHITDDIERVTTFIKAKRIINPEHGYRELGPGLYISEHPQLWVSRHRGKWDFLKHLTKKERERLETVIAEELFNDARTHYISASEFQQAMDALNRWIDNPKWPVYFIASQPYNIRFWQQSYLKRAKIEVQEAPILMLYIEAKGKFIELKRPLGGTEWKRLIKHFDGAVLPMGFSEIQQAVIWNPYSITEMKETKYDH